MERDTNQCRVLYTMRTLGIIDLGMSPGAFGLELSPRCGSAGVTPEEAISILLDFLLCLFCKGQNSHVHNQTARGEKRDKTAIPQQPIQGHSRVVHWISVNSSSRDATHIFPGRSRKIEIAHPSSIHPHFWTPKARSLTTMPRPNPSAQDRFSISCS